MKSGFKEPDFTVRLIYTNTNLQFSTAVEAFIFCSCRKRNKRARSRPTVLRIPLCRRLSMTLYEQENYFSHSYSLANCRFHSLRQYLEFGLIFGYTSRLLLYFRLYCSLANEVLLIFTIYILLTRISQILILYFQEPRA